MDQTRETKTLQTPSGKELVIKTYLTAGERNAARSAVFARFKFNVDGSTAEAKDMSADVLVDGDNKLVEMAVVSFDGKKEKVLEALLNDYPADEYDFVVAEAKSIRGGDFLKVK